MEKRDRLHQLVHSLNKSEKRFFKVYSSRHVIGDQNKYVLLFDYLASRKKYKEEDLLKQFKGEKFIKRLSVPKAYLYDLILKSMKAYHAGKTVDTQLLDILSRTQFLIEKNLFDQAQKTLVKAKNLALDTESLVFMPLISKLEKKILESRFFSGSSIERIEQLHQSEKEVLEKLLNINDYWILDSELYYQHNRGGIIRHKNELKQLEHVLNSPLMRHDEKAICFESKFLLHKIYSTYFFILRDFDSCYNNVKKLVNHLESRPDISRHYPLQYVQALNNLLNMTEVLKKSKETTFYLGKLKDMMEDESLQKQENLQLKLFESYYYHQLNQIRRKTDHPETRKCIEAIDEGLEKWNGKVDKMGRVMLCYSVAQILFTIGAFSESYEWFAKITHRPSTDIRQDVYSFSLLMKLVCAYETHNPNHYKKAIKKAREHFELHPTSYKVERIILDFFKSNPLENPQAIDSLQSLYQEILGIADDPFEKKAFAYFDFPSWIENKLSKKSTSFLVEA